MKKYEVYNLEFPHNVEEFTIDGYKFKSKSDYIKRFLELDSHVNVVTDKYTNTPKYGTHVITGDVFLPNNEKKPILRWANQDSTRLSDITFILSLFTTRNVFIYNVSNGVPYVSHQTFPHGGILACSITYETPKYTKEELEEIDVTEVPNIGFEKGINKIVNVMKSKRWRELYNDGFYLFLFKQSCESSNLEISFLQCWTIWEHLYYLHFPTVAERDGALKIANVLNFYFGTKLNLTARMFRGKRYLIGKTRNVERMKNIRNGLVHDGSLNTRNIKMRREKALRYMKFFIQLTEQLVVRTFELKPSEVFDTTKKLNKWINGQL